METDNSKSELIRNLENYLATVSPEQFEKDWDEVAIPKDMNYQLIRVKACAECYDHPAGRDRCICWFNRNYPTIELEVKQCKCCNHIEEGHIPFTEFNRKQLGDGFFTEEIAEEELQKRINSFTYITETFRDASAHLHKNEAAVKVTCIETGKSVECSKHRSSYQNIAEAKRILNE